MILRRVSFGTAGRERLVDEGVDGLTGLGRETEQRFRRRRGVGDALVVKVLKKGSANSITTMVSLMTIDDAFSSENCVFLEYPRPS